MIEYFASYFTLMTQNDTLDTHVLALKYVKSDTFDTSYIYYRDNQVRTPAVVQCFSVAYLCYNKSNKLWICKKTTLTY